ncbi:tryptophan-rich sensory protein [Nitratireductor aquimarinus]|uniref:TspO/MBR family protein n=1 Tax=Nitratireductor aquimarinus TaxID=889300 RepID=A0ABU4AJY9_9HYPH|nr:MULTISPECIES: TspO/MBR family protein [Alphaproteobacteria]MBY6021411.1 tryptophan-rich sensory protein [Nitratireductor sp. DP7N14-4]MBN7756625.1 tryptophan-rich sensory protein [Nitratireductor aquimarinus]MBN7777035.1 tryptophan-rich sensory protein [Nitratireductor pacificus]MBN7780369.1 tryptophan-rich sensory protein [Nitratireductor pacificus]MBN7789176.1 tryptophan-rich sensory protein [Nitratireductor aquimarinus]
MPIIRVLPVFLLLVVGAGLAIGYITAPGPWYAALAKPAFNPPNWVFAPVWTILYVLIAVAGARTWQRARHGMAMRLWWLQLVLNFAWSPAFFVLHQVGLALLIILLLAATITAFIAASWRSDRASALMFLPYAAWVFFAALLNGAILSLN